MSLLFVVTAALPVTTNVDEKSHYRGLGMAQIP